MIIGRLGRDPELRTFPSGDQVANLSVATSEKWKDKASGEQREATEWHRIVVNGRLAEIAGQYLKKGSLAYFEGKITTRKWTDQAGVEKYATELRCDRMQLLGGNEQGGGGGQQQAPQQRQQAPQQRAAAPAQQQGGGYGPMDDDIPFAPMRMWE